MNKELTNYVPNMNYIEQLKQKFEDTILPENLQNDIWTQLNNSHISDSVHLADSQREILRKFWYNDNIPNEQIPADIIIQNTIPIPDIEIVYHLKDTALQIKLKMNARITIFPEKILAAPDAENSIYIIGAVTLGAIVGKYTDLDETIVPIVLRDNDDNIKIYTSVINTYKKNNTTKTERLTEANLHLTSMILQSWYGIQISLLHPVIKNIFSHGKPIARYDKTNKNKVVKNKRKRITYNVSTHYINDGTLENLLQTKNHKEFTTLAWYVIGHWRHYKNGKKTFIQGYWKGPLREMKQNLDTGRDRKIISISEGETT